ncbi:MocE family 2Fe-2S type ferredoxin [Rhodoferax saidenbachensis]|uniref:3-phenylpropionate/trans-cinnamate dioxygenase ferredoxin subunit n=1 Tax=Rhodoferax saidenbachensis TaxID=1484693 RepID=A0ABU1ZJQ4_9BURK|nr:MocE family 2Fe-2S type ferredoxin [Rhodoferax saidenbachensis]MDR7305780.1 3-phenylpropionate/trans-cinnamate dioxygenase ferredoxin subunit [Rhodoferax saidenbachensis]
MNHWTDVCAFDAIDDEDVLRFDHAGKTYAVYRVEDRVYATDGLCSHEKIHLADGLVMDHVIECPKHNGRFDIRNGQALGAPVCVNLRTWRARVHEGRIQIQPEES